ncbi:glucose 1-dehydrogenase [Sphingomonas sp.]|uniref:SDR family NAD(P)-dependent oxidoreductase n=1 Tax=Sphingomonas sp. TaxID=28214 RepID=UPI002E331B68|nr:glucose 1-dehydrogenase [Sphingomonas sp.]HEX4694674.1 glucose 1-dehydrogenase [Sphingomonas sp.]
MERRFDDKVAIVTGAAGGIGAAIAARLHAEGAAAVIADLKGDAAQAAADKLVADAGGTAIGVACDVGSEEQVAAAVQTALDRFGRVDVIVNNAGLMTFKTLAEFTGDDWLKVLRVDLLGAAFFTRQGFLHFGDKGGTIVNIASVHAIETSANAAPYSAAKAALLSLTRTTSIEGRDLKIRANAVLPGAIDTPMLWDNPNVKSGAETIDKRDVGTPEDVAAAVAFLASDDAKFITGTTLAVDGGRLAKL